MNLKKFGLVAFLSFLSVLFLVNTVSSVEEFTLHTEKKKEETLTRSKLTAHLRQLKVNNAVIKVNDLTVNGDVLKYNEKYYVPSTVVTSLQQVKLNYNSILNTVTVARDEESFQLPVTEPKGPLWKNKRVIDETSSEYQHALFVAEKVYVPLSFINSHLQYEVTASKKQNLLVNIEEESADLPLDVPLIHQMAEPRLYNGCEITSLAMLLQYHGMNVTKNQLAKKVKYVPLTYTSGLKGNPNKGFVGDMENGPGLGVSHGPVTDLAKKYAGERALDITGSEVDKMYSFLKKGMPVWVITTANFSPVSNFQTWNTPSGEVDITFSVHSVVVTGFDQEAIYVNDPYGGKNKKVDKDAFEQAWKQMGRQAIVIEG